MKRWIYWRLLRFFVKTKKYSFKVFRKIEKIEEFTEIQKNIYNVAVRLIHKPNSTLIYVNGIYQIKYDNFTITVRQKYNSFSINFVEYRGETIINNFNEIYDLEHIKILIDNFNRELSKRIKHNSRINDSKIEKHLNSILEEINYN